MRILFCGGGTAGHVMPAVAIAEAVKERDKNCEILFVGRENGNENRAVINAHFPLKTIKICGLKRSLSPQNIKNIAVAISALSKAKKILRDFKPDVVVGTGGYVSWPIVKTAQKMKIKTVLHESNASPGLVTKMLGPSADLLLLNLQGSDEKFKRKDNVLTVGNPVRKEFYETSKISARKKLGIRKNELVITSFGGSGGSEVLNSTILKLMDSHTSKVQGIVHIHSAGVKYYDDIKASRPKYTDGSCRATVKPYIDNMAETVAASDIVISRCGAMSIAELAAAGKAAILIPSPNVTNDHQKKNAQHIANAGACIFIEEKNLTEHTLFDAVKRLEGDKKLRDGLGKKLENFYVPKSAEIICDAIFRLLNVSAAK